MKNQNIPIYYIDEHMSWELEKMGINLKESVRGLYVTGTKEIENCKHAEKMLQLEMFLSMNFTLPVDIQTLLDNEYLIIDYYTRTPLAIVTTKDGIFYTIRDYRKERNNG